MTMELRAVAPGEWDHWYGRVHRAFGGTFEGEPVERREFWRSVTEFDRSLAMWDADEVVGTAGTFSFRLSVPGGALVPAAGLTMVSVQSTHRRRGVLTAMMRRQLDEVRGKGEPLAVLTASEPAIYGRFGYGCASQQLSLTVDTDRAGLVVPEGAAEVRLRLLPAREALKECEAVYARRVPQRPGMLARQPGWEQEALLGRYSRPDGMGELLCVLAERDGEAVGFARYALKPEWQDGVPQGSVLLNSLEALDPAAYGALWRYLFDIDLTNRVVAGNRPVDDPLLHLVLDPRRCRPALFDGLFLRPVDIPAALTARTYSAPVDVVLEVRDPFCPWNEGRWRISGDATGARCEATAAPADLELSAVELGSAYLGGFSLEAMAQAGRVRELRRGALAEASAAFLGGTAPWLPHGF